MKAARRVCEDLQSKVAYHKKNADDFSKALQVAENNQQYYKDELKRLQTDNDALRKKLTDPVPNPVSGLSAENKIKAL